MNKASKLKIGIVIFCALLLIAVVVVAITASTKQKDGTIYFYSEDVLIDQCKLSSVNQSYLNYLKAKVKTEPGYNYHWSASADELVNINLSKLKPKDRIYLIKIPHIYDTIYSVDEDISYEVIAGELTYDSTYKFKVPVDENTKVFVTINDEDVFPDKDGVYSYIVKQKLRISISTKQICIITASDVSYTYDGTQKELQYNLSITENIEADMKVSYYQDSSYTIPAIAINSGNYYVKVEYIGDKYYIEPAFATLTINKGSTTVTSWPEIEKATIGQTLSKVHFSNGSANVHGYFKWTNDNTVVSADINKYSMTFIPTDSNYESITMEVTVLVVSVADILEIVAIERNRLIEQVSKLNLVDNLILPTTSNQSDTLIEWYSMDTLVQIDEDGKVTLIDEVENYAVTLYAVLYCEDAVEYLSFEFIVNNKQQTVSIVETASIATKLNYENGTVDCIKAIILTNDDFDFYLTQEEVKEISFSQHSVNKTMKIDNLLSSGQVSEIIEWIVISDTDNYIRI